MPTTAARLGRDIALAISVANLGAAVLVWWQLAVLTPPWPGSTAANVDTGPVEELALAGLLLIAGWFFVRRRVEKVAAWIDEGRQPTTAERDALLRQPGERALVGQIAWTAAAVVAVTYNVTFSGPAPAMEHIRTFLGIALGGTVASALSFIITERILRPTWAIALAGAAPDRSRSIGVRPRLLLAWALGSGIPVFGIGIALLRPPSTDLDQLRAPLLFLVIVALLAGGLLLAANANAVAEPLDAVRGAMGRVAGGDLDVTVPVDDGGEIGFLQAGFNHMVAGLRERRALADLFGRHVGIDVARQAVAGGVSLGGEEREVTVLFVDLAGSSALAERLPPDQVVAFLNQFFAAVVSCVTTEGGWVDKFEGDGALCVWGAPGDDDHHRDHALRTARSLRDEIERMKAAHPEIDAGIGVASGRVIAGNIGTEERFEYTVIGDPVNEAARLTEAAKTRPERILASGPAVAGAGEVEKAGWTPAGEVALRGRARPTAVFVAPTGRVGPYGGGGPTRADR